MPVVRYFIFVGGALLALLLISGWVLPTISSTDVTDAGSDKPVIRINSERKWPERVVFDTSVPTIVPVQSAGDVAPAPVAETTAKPAAETTKVREAFAQLAPSGSRKPELPAPKKRRIAKKRVAPPPTVLVAQQPRFGFFGNNVW